MKRKLTLIAITCVVILSSISLLTMMTIPTYADTPTQPQAADAMWVDPPSITLTPSNSSVGTKFNVTVWLNMTEDVFTYQIAMLYNRTLLACTRCGFTGGTGSNYYSGHSSQATPAVIDTSFLGNGSVLATESALAPDKISGPHSGSLIWIEFQVLFVPTSGSLTSKFDISTKANSTPARTWVKDPSLTGITLATVADGNYIVTPEFEYLLILPVFAAMTAFAVVMRKRVSKKN